MQALQSSRKYSYSMKTITNSEGICRAMEYMHFILVLIPKKNPQISTTEHLWFLQGFAISNIFVAVSPSKTWRKSQN